MKLPAYVKYFILGFIILVILSLVMLFNIAFKSNVELSHGKDHAFIKIATGSTYEDVIDTLQKDSLLENHKTFRILAKRKNYPNHVYPGNYKIEDGMSNNELINLLRSGKQEPVDVIFNNIRTASQLAGIISGQIEADSAAIDSLLHDESFLKQYGLNKQTRLTIFIPNTYEFFWDTQAKDFIERMAGESKTFWSGEREEKLKNIPLNQKEVFTLASIVDEETAKQDEMDRIAGVYMNRLKRGMRLQADPTIKYAHGNFGMKRVLKKHLEVDSPYNTYKYSGLPPGPISVPSIQAIDAVLNYEDHSYLYFCAKDDFSGYHVFSRNLRQHLNNARKYQRALTEKRIFR